MENERISGQARSISELRSFKNPYSLEDTVLKLRSYLRATKRDDAMALLEKAVEKAKTSSAYFNQFEDALLRGSTIELRELLSDFGDYWARTSDSIPYYPHHDAVNAIDTAMFHIKIGDEKQAIDDYNFLHNR